MNDDAPSLLWLDQGSSLGPQLDLDWALDLLRAAQAGTYQRLVRVYRPEPTLSFGQRDARLPGFKTAADAAREHGFAPVIRRAGGRAAPYHRGSLVVDHLEYAPDSKLETQRRFAQFAQLFVRVFAAVGIEAEVGEIAGEYCPGEHSVHTRRASTGAPIKIVGTAQRVIKDAWLFSSSIVVQDPEPIRQVVQDVYAALELPFVVDTAGAASEAGQIDVPRLSAALKREYEGNYRVQDVPFETVLHTVAPTLPV